MFTINAILYLVLCALSSDEDPLRIEASINYNEKLKSNKVFCYKIYKSTNANEVEWRMNYHTAKNSDVVFMENDKQVYYREYSAFDMKMTDLKARVDSGKTNDGITSTTVPALFPSEVVIYDKDRMIEYKRVPMFKHAEMMKISYPRIQNSVYNYGVLGASHEYTLPRLFQLARTGSITLAIKQHDSESVICKFVDKDDMTIECHLLRKMNYIPSKIIMYDKNGIQNGENVNVTKVVMEDFIRIHDGMNYPRKIYGYLIQHDKIVLGTATVIDSISPYDPVKSVLVDSINDKQSVHIRDIPYSSMAIPFKSISYEEVAGLYKQCEDNSVATIARKKNSSQLSALSIFYVVIPACLVAVSIYSYYKHFRLRKPSCPAS